jgi:hypothetical protein
MRLLVEDWESSGGLPFSAHYGYIGCDTPVGRKACPKQSNQHERARREAMDQVVEQVVEQEVVELSLAEMAQVGGGVIGSALS